MQNIIGWDVGGAHLKAARVENGIITQAVQIPCPLWLGLGELDRAFTNAKEAIGRAPLNAITMTGESCDAFATREEGVAGLAAIMVRLLSPGRALFYAGRSGFIGDSEAADHAIEIASANWHASAALTGARKGTALFVDIGSTTTDLIPIAEGQPASLGYTDAERLAHGELVYSGIARSFLMAGPRLVPFAGRWTPLMNEWFATMADVYRILGRLPEGADLMDAADGRERSEVASRARLARMIGCDSSEADDAAWEALAQFFAEAQLRDIMDAAALVLSRGLLDSSAPVVGAGTGRGVIRELAARIGRTFIAFDDLIEAVSEARSKACDCAPASAVALLAAAQFFA
jgi:(4-(4-[2-(gamma-L-glutamylamino)ethyl]phenoxymethyl)furan-2-yl)methanamine synthase